MEEFSLYLRHIPTNTIRSIPAPPAFSDIQAVEYARKVKERIATYPHPDWQLPTE